MKNDKLISSIGAVVIILGSIMKILHLPYANMILIISFIGMSIYQAWLVSYLKGRIKELEAKVGA